MSSSYTANTGIEKIASGEQEGEWGNTTNLNLDIIDRALSGVGSISLSGTTHTLTTTDGTLTDGMYRVLLFTGALGANNTVTISPNDQDKLYFVVNNTTDSGSSGPYSVIIKQGTGATVTVENGRADIVYADGAGSGAAVVSLGTEIGQRAFDLYTYTATAGQTTFTGSDTASKTLAYSAGNLFVTLNGVTLENGTDYTATNGTSVVLTDAATVSDELNIYAFNAFSVANVTTASADFSIGDDLSFTSDGAIINMGADSDVTITHNADEGITLNSKDISGVSSINGGQIGGSRNYIYNGDTSLCQRATSASGLGNGDSGYHVQDRYKFAEAGAPNAEVTMSRATEVPSGFQYSMKLDCTTASGTVAAADLVYFSQIFEGQDLYGWKKGTSDALPVTLSFWVNTTKTGTYICSMYDNDNARNCSQAYTVSSSNTWEYKSVTFPGDTTGAFGRDANASLYVHWGLVAGTDWSSGTLATAWQSNVSANQFVGQVDAFDNTSNNFHITGMQLELGETASAFQNETYGENFIRCARYYLQRAASSAALYGSSVTGGGFNYSHWQFPVPMRTAPTMTGHTGTQQQISVLSGGVYNSAGSYAVWGNGSTASAEL